MWPKESSTKFYLFLDWVGGLIAWSSFFYFRKVFAHKDLSMEQIFVDDRYFLGVGIIPVLGVIGWAILGSYQPIYKRSRWNVLNETLIGILLGSLILLLTVLVDDEALQHFSYLKSFVILFLLHFIVFVIIRMTYLTFVSRQFKSGEIKLRTLGIGDEKMIQSSLQPYHQLNRVVGLNDFNNDIESLNNCEEIILTSLDADLLNRIKNIAYHYSPQCDIKVIGPPNIDFHLMSKLDYDYVNEIFTLRLDNMPQWQQNIKRLIDIIISTIAIVILAPFCLILFLLIQSGSHGHALFLQERIGKGMRPFNIIKFRTMYDNAEENGPQLSHAQDGRITSIGKILRKYRLDEIPQFINVIKGDMSIVGPRPERMHYIEQILEQSEHVSRLYSVRPGITSWGQVKYGYASSIESILKRLRYDLLYIENRSLLLDFKIMFYTILVLIKGEGR